VRPGAGTARHPIITGALALVVAGGVLGCAPPGDEGITLRFWAFGREGEVVAELVPEFERTHPGIRVVVQQMPWTAAHEKLLTAHVGRTTPDVAQLGNTWIPEFAALEALAPLGLTVLPPEGERLWTLNAVKVPEGVDEAAVRKHLLEAFNIEIGAGLGPLAGRIWRIGLMGASSSPRLVIMRTGALESALTQQRRAVGA